MKPKTSFATFVALGATLAVSTPSHADAWSQYRALGPANERGMARGPTRGVRWSAPLKEGISLPKKFRLEPESIDNYLASPVGTPLIGLADLSTGIVYLHPSARVYTLTVADFAVPAVNGTYDIESALAPTTELNRFLSAQHRATLRSSGIVEADGFTMRGDFDADENYHRLLIGTEIYSRMQIPYALHRVSNQLSRDQTEALAMPRSALGMMRHNGKASPHLVYHSRNHGFVTPAEMEMLAPACTLQNPVSSHDCVESLLVAAGVKLGPTIGFAVQRHDPAYCTTPVANRIGINAMYFSGTSRSNNKRIFGDNSDAELPVPVAQALYNAIVGDLRIDAASFVPCGPVIVEAQPEVVIDHSDRDLVQVTMRWNGNGQHEDRVHFGWLRDGIELLGETSELTIRRGDRESWRGRVLARFAYGERSDFPATVVVSDVRLVDQE